ncbi:MAG TPA: hypothetical protein VIG74_06690 [Alphaproteobacteria bacterium]|jgi:peptidoglycan/LPS O-acetylase OafA/YrhL
MIRSKVMLSVLLLTGAAAAILGLAQMWWEPLAWEIFIKSMVTLLVLGLVASFLTAIDYDMPGSRGKIILAALALLAVAGGGLVVAQMWWHVMTYALFGKVLITLLIIGGLLSFFAAVSEDFGMNKRLKDNKYID